MIKTRESYNSYFKDFITHRNRNICLFKGSWGIGKTYFWKDFIKKNIGLYEFRAYSYVSLFGLNELYQIKEEIFANVQLLKEKLEILNKTDAIKRISSLSKKIPFLKEYQGLISHFENSFIKNFLVCFDDIERRSDKISLKTFLGFCNQLKEESGCKIVIIMNEDEISKNKEDFEQLNKYREKVIDIELLFEPTLKENYLLIFGEDTKFNVVYQTIERLQITNLRILQRIKWNLEYFDNYFKYCEPSVREYYLNRITLISYFILTGDASKEDGAIFKSIDDEFNDSLFEKKKSILSQFHYYYETNDKHIIEYVTNYKFDETSFIAAVDELNEKEKKSQIRSKINSIWNEYSANFKLSPNGFKTKLENLLAEYLEFLSRSDLESIINALKKLDDSFDENIWWDKFIELHLAEFDLDTLKQFQNKINNKRIQEIIAQKINKEYQALSIKDVIYHIANKNSWSPRHIERLKLAEEDEFYNWFLEEEDDGLLYNLRSFLKTFNPSTPDEDYRNIGIKIINALNKVAKLDKLKELRVREFFNIKGNV